MGVLEQLAVAILAGAQGLFDAPAVVDFLTQAGIGLPQFFFTQHQFFFRDRGLLEFGDHEVEFPGHIGKLILALLGHAMTQVARRHGRGALYQFLERLGDGPDQHQRNSHPQQQENRKQQADASDNVAMGLLRHSLGDLQVLHGEGLDLFIQDVIHLLPQPEESAHLLLQFGIQG